MRLDDIMNCINYEDAMAEQTTTFLLRISPEVKEAVRALSNAEKYMEYKPASHHRLSAPFDSMNTAFAGLIEIGMLEMTEYILVTLNETSEIYLEPLSEIMKFFLNNPTADFCSPDDFDEGSTERDFVEDTMEMHPKMSERGLSRSWVSDAYAFEQRRRMVLESTADELIKAFNSGHRIETSQLLIDDLCRVIETDPAKGTEDASAFLSETTKTRIREIGTKLLELGGKKLILHAHKEVEKRHEWAVQHLYFAWSGIGGREA